jgi:hypothetical protein
LLATGRVVAGDIVLFTASTDNSGGVNPISVPNNNNPYLPAISPGVALNPRSANLDGNAVGPLNGITYGPFGWINDTGGTTGFVTVSYTLPAAGSYRLIWEVANTTDSVLGSALATDNARLDGVPMFNGFESGIPPGSATLGTVGTSGPIPGLSPTEGSSFAYLDTTGQVAPIFDVVDGMSASRLYSPVFTAGAGTTLSLDVAFLTSDGGPFDDYGIVALAAVPEPSSLVLLATATVGLAVVTWRRRARSRRGP